IEPSRPFDAENAPETESKSASRIVWEARRRYPSVPPELQHRRIECYGSRNKRAGDVRKVRSCQRKKKAKKLALHTMGPMHPGIKRARMSGESTGPLSKIS